MRKLKAASETEDIDKLRNERDRLRQEIQQLQMEHDILKKADEMIKNDPGTSAGPLTNREKTKVADALRETYPLSALLSTLGLARSSYFYHRAALQAGDKHAVVRVTLAGLFHTNYRCYSYRRLHAMLRHEGVRLSEKVVRRLMSEETLVVSKARRRRYSSYC